MSHSKPHLEDLNVVVLGQGGDGSLTVISILADVLRSAGLRAYTERNVLSRIKGGIVAATLRVSSRERLCTGSEVDLLLAFDALAVAKHVHRLSQHGIVIYDNSGGSLPADSGIADGTRVIG
ncbi:MAG: 2-oxoacid:acceptor oxidoreductase family protein, partial [Arenicellales bacterium]|nr:2-oxoacid:acceptor oxidoreductase family protein [Arenicellales bacterium]